MGPLKLDLENGKTYPVCIECIALEEYNPSGFEVS